MGSVEWRCDSGKRTGIKIAFQLCQSLRNSSTPEPPKSRGRFAETRIEQEMRPRACRFESKIALSRVTNLRCRDARKAGVKHRCDQTSKRRMQRQQYLVDLGKIMAIPQRLEILADYRLHHCPHARDTPEFDECGRTCGKMVQHIDRGNRIHGARANRQSRRVGKNPARRGLARANLNHRRRTIERSHRESACRQRSSIVASAGANFQDGSSAQQPQTLDQLDRNRRLDAPRIVICGGNLAVVDRSGNWHGKNPTMCSVKTMRPAPL